MSFIKRFFGKSKKEEEPEDIAHYDGGEDGCSGQPFLASQLEVFQ
jgi:hypothetical protein